ncbi:MAG: S8 family serine peptidase [Clostridia bacterium]|nr:S8 family serine peptidase [Clostridia bacterium]
MLTKIISFVMAVVTSLVGMGSSAFAATADSVFSSALSLVTERSAFLEDITDEDVSQFDENSGYIKNMLLVFFEEDASFFAKLSALRKTGGAVVGSMPEAQLCVVRTSGLNYEKLTALCEEIMLDESVALASVCPASRIADQYTPNDPFTDYDWYTEYWNEAEPSGNNWWLEATDTRAAWGYNSYFEDIDIGIVDGGFNELHEELEGKISFPSASEAKRNNRSYHGTHVAGIIAAKGDNGVGISGICQNSELICVDWSPSDSQMWIGDVAIFFGFGKVVKAGAKVLNFSLGASGSLGANQRSWGSFVQNLDAMLYSCYMSALLNSGYDFVVVQSSGNGNSGGNAVDASANGCFCAITENNTFIPYSGIKPRDLLDRIIIVGSARVENGAYIQADSSNVGDIVDICAPGVDIYSCSTEGYMSLSGTSMAAPVVTGIASLVWSVDGDLSGADVKKIVCSNTCDTVAPAPEYYFDSLNTKAYPMVNAKLAVEAALKNKYEMNTVSINLGGTAQIKFINEDLREFVFETDASGVTSCLLESGTYTVEVNGEAVRTDFAVEADTEFVL